MILLGTVVLTTRASVLDRPEGIKIGKRMTLRPYVAFSVSYDSNVRSTHDNQIGDVMWTISPGLGVTYNAENWSLLLSGYYNYRRYCKSENKDYNRHSYGEDLRWNWANSTGVEKGWSLVLGESFQQMTMADDMTLDDGRGYNADTRQFQAYGTLQRRFNEHWHADVNGGFYWLDYLNDTTQRNSLYGWSRWNIGAEVGFAPSKWTDILLTGNYQNYSQDNAEGSLIANNHSRGFTFQGGLGSYLTERISYRLLAGWSTFQYGDGAATDNGFTYTASGNWKIGETWNTMLLGTSYYQPSEQQYASRSRVDAFSWGLAKTMIRGKLRATLDLRYRRESHEYVGSGSYDYVVNVITGRLGFDYNLNRLIAFFLYGEYQKSWNSEADERGYAYDYDRWRVSAGFRLKY